MTATRCQGRGSDIDQREETKMNALPEVTIASADRRRLVSIATAALVSERDGVAASMLLSEIARATVVSRECLPSNVVDMDCEVEVRDNIDETTRRLRIVYPGDDDGGYAISVLTPIGAALIGLPEGASVDWCTAAGDRSSLTVLRVRRRSPTAERTPASGVGA
jgi:regulator of nucleoside diphosphate kinase